MNTQRLVPMAFDPFSFPCAAPTDSALTISHPTSSQTVVPTHESSSATEVLKSKYLRSNFKMYGLLVGSVWTGLDAAMHSVQGSPLPCGCPVAFIVSNVQSITGAYT